MTNEEKKEVNEEIVNNETVEVKREIKAPSEIKEKKEEVVDADNDGFIDKDPGMFYEEMKEEASKTEEPKVVAEEVKVEEAAPKVEETKVDVKVDDVKESSDNSINNVVKVAEEKVAMNNAETGKNIELANNIVKEGKIEENKNLPADIKPILDIIKEKLKAAGKVITNVLEMVGDMVEGIFKKKN